MTLPTTTAAPEAVRAVLRQMGETGVPTTRVEMILDALRRVAQEPTRMLLEESHSLFLPGWRWPEHFSEYGMMEEARLKDAFLSGWSTALAMLLGIDGNHVLDEVLRDA